MQLPLTFRVQLLPSSLVFRLRTGDETIFQFSPLEKFFVRTAASESNATSIKKERQQRSRVEGKD